MPLNKPFNLLLDWMLSSDITITAIEIYSKLIIPLNFSFPAALSFIVHTANIYRQVLKKLIYEFKFATKMITHDLQAL